MKRDASRALTAMLRGWNGRVLILLGLSLCAFGVIAYRERAYTRDISEAMGFSISNDVISFYGRPVPYTTNATIYSRKDAELAARMLSTQDPLVKVTVRQFWKHRRVEHVIILEVETLPDRAILSRSIPAPGEL